MLLPGEKRLANQLLDITKTAREQESTIPEQGRILHEMGKLYLKDAIETGINGEQFVKASALINAALVRTEDSSDQETLQRRLYDVHKGLLRNIEGAKLGFSVEKLATEVNRNKDHLHAIRVEVHEMCKSLEQLFESYRIEHFTCLDIEMKILDKVATVSSSVQQQMLKFVKSLWRQAIEMCQVSPPCSYAVIGLGSIARQEITPYSDLEFALLIERDSPEIKEYFKSLVYLFHTHVLALGETPLPAIAIESLNDFLSPGGDKFCDIITPRGFRLDGAMPWACKTPLGRKETPKIEALDLIKTPEAMAELLREDNVLGQAYRVSDVLLKSVHICGEPDIYERFISSSDEVISKINHKEKARRSLVADYDQSPDWSVTRCSEYNFLSKQLYYRFPSTFVENLRIYFTPYYRQISSLEVLNHFCKAGILSKQGTFNLKVSLAFYYGFRLLTYLKNRGQYESFFFMKTPERPFNKKRDHHPLGARSKCRIAYFKNEQLWSRMQLGCNGLRHIIDVYFKGKSPCEFTNLKRELFCKIDEESDYYSFSWNGGRHTFGILQWARASKELPPTCCGHECGVKRLISFTKKHWRRLPPSAMLRALDDILDIKDCKCLLLLRNTILVSKASTILRYKLRENIPEEADILTLLEKYQHKRYKNVRERYYLLHDINELSQYVKNEHTMLSAIEMAEAFFKDISNFEESQQRMINMMKFSLNEKLMELYRRAEQFDKCIELCQQQIDKDEMIFGIDCCHPRTGRWYLTMGDIYQQCGMKEKALNCLEKGFDMHLNISKNSSYTGEKGENEEYVKECHWRIMIRFPAFRMARLYVEQERFEDAIKVLTIAFIKDGKSFDIKTWEDIGALFMLCENCYRLGEEIEKYLKNGSQYLEELLDVITRDNLWQENKHRLQSIRLMAFITAKYHIMQNRLEDAVKVLTKAMTKDGTSYDIETEQDRAMIGDLSYYCHELRHTSEQYLHKGNQYMEEYIEYTVKMARGTLLDPYPVLKLVDSIYSWIRRLGHLEISKMLSQRSASEFPPSNLTDYTNKDHPYVVDYILKKYYQRNNENKTEEEALIMTLCKLLDNRGLQEYFLETVKLNDYTLLREFFFILCRSSVHPGFDADYFLPSFITFRRSMLQQAEIFCEKVIKGVVSKNIHKMCLLYITFQRLRMMHCDYIFTRDNEQMRSAFKISVATLVEFQQFFPDCHTAYKVTNLMDFVRQVETVPMRSALCNIS